MNFSSENFMKSVARSAGAQLPADAKRASAAKTKFDAMLYLAAKTHFDAAVSAASAAGVKTVQAHHTAAARSKKGAMFGGAETVLPAEYFGKDSGSYFPQEAVGGMEHSAFSPQLTRAALPMSGGNKQQRRCPCMLGGAETVLPSEYFGRDSGAYFGSDITSALEHTSISSTLTRPALPMSGGGALLLPDTLFSQLWTEYRRRKVAASSARLSSTAKRTLRARIANSIFSATMSTLSKGPQPALLTAGLLQKSAKQVKRYM